jgi:outer membrane lipoprotein SlyB
MDNPNASTPQRARLHPLVATAAVAVIVLSAVGVTALVMNHSNATPSPYDAPPVAQGTAPEQQPEAARVASAPAVAAPAPQSSAPTTPRYDDPPPVARAEAPACRDCGIVDSIRDIKVKGQGTGVGAVGGAVVGGLLGNMVGAGRGKALATVAGAVGGGFGGNAIEKNVRAEVEHQMIVRLDNGGTRTFTQASPFPYREGERVRIVDGHVERV